MIEGVKVEWHNDKYELRAKVKVEISEEERPIDITVQRWSSFGHRNELRLRPAEVNWPCLGAVPPEAAERFAQGLMVASKVATEMNKPFYPITVVFENAEKTEWNPQQFLGNNVDQIKSILERDRFYFEKHGLSVKNILYPQETPEHGNWVRV
jgi:hypothetical protein